ncbi:hypothetical protein XENOCAPTIV_013970 [Xenoophorus captivus]|uniref:Uncharacterized protein n=1 Tax=Xenoophorus captivus TaxID=1517983 RepID=A0ABV0R0A7_9TELE
MFEGLFLMRTAEWFALNFPHEAFMQTRKVRKLNLVLRESAVSYVSIKVSRYKHAVQAHTHGQSHVYKIWKAFSSETHLISVNATIFVLHCTERVWCAWIE